jgi:hypothetical protein
MNNMSVSGSSSETESHPIEIYKLQTFLLGIKNMWSELLLSVYIQESCWGINTIKWVYLIERHK